VHQDEFCEEARVNLTLLKWKRGKIFDDKVCEEFYNKIDDRPTALLCILAFRRANRYPIDLAWEQSVLKQEPSDSLGLQLQK